MKYLVLLLVLMGFAGTASAYTIHDLDYENSSYQNKKTPSLGKPIDLLFQIGNNDPVPQDLHVTVTITNTDEHNQVYKKEYANLISPGETIDIRWNFTPQTPGLYLVEITDDSGTHSKRFFAVPESDDQKRLPITNPELDDISPRKQFRMGVDPKLIICKDGLFLALKTSNLPVCLTLDTLVELRHRDFVEAEVIDYDKIGYIISENQFVAMLKERNIEYDKENLMLISGFSQTSLPPTTGYCGYVIDDKQEDYWFSGSYHFPTLGNSELVDDNPHPCEPNSYSCECSIQTQLAEKNQKELSYFDQTQETQIGTIFADYLNEGGKITNVPNSFVIGKYNLAIAPDVASFCGQFQGNAYWYFHGSIKESKVIDFFLDLAEKPKLCAIKENPQKFTFDESAIVKQ